MPGLLQKSLHSRLHCDGAEFSFATNAPPAGGHVESDLPSVTAAVDKVLLQSLGWTDDVDDLPLKHSFGFLYGYQEAFLAARSVLSWERFPGKVRPPLLNVLQSRGYLMSNQTATKQSLIPTVHRLAVAHILALRCLP